MSVASTRVRKPFAEQVKPTSFLLVAYLNTGTLIREAYREAHGHLAGVRPIRPVAPYDSNPKNWPKLPWQDLHTGELVTLSWSKKRTYSASELPVQTYHDVIARYLRHPEAKAAGGDGVGVLRPLHIVVTDVRRIHHIGKEANRLDEVQVFGLAPNTYLRYDETNATQEWVRTTIAKIPPHLAAKYAGLSARQITRFIAGKATLRRHVMGRLIAMAEGLEKAGRDEERFIRFFQNRIGIGIK